ncbi:thioredoxin family protein [Stenotrophomonas maltophilia]|jgi:thiol-disulfide isomerase/thioredoxin|uniref:Thioredoxin family protein n=1 Tax=Stenotrophomonas maltophilia TaxID=40324 RepID=A0A2W6I898_STEMA|nr:thioredoxin family protein [Stenotrophomonas maltophilia]
MIRTLRRVLVLAAALLAAGGVATAAPVDPASRPRPNEVPPQILGKDRDGNLVDLGTQRGKVVIVTFWASWCGPCRKELPMLGNLQRVVGRDALQVYAVNFKEPRRDFISVIRNRNAPVLDYIHDAKGEVSDQYGIQTIPHMFIIGQDGRIAHIHRGYSEESLPKVIDAILAQLPEEVRNRPPQG